MEGQSRPERQPIEEFGFGEERFGGKDVVAGVVPETVLAHPYGEVFELGEPEIARREEGVEIEDAIAVDVRVETAYARRVGRDELAEGCEAVRFAHEDGVGDVEWEGARSVHEAERHALVVLFADDGPERGRTERDLPPFLADVRGGDDEGAATEEAEDVDEEFGRETIDGPQFTFQDGDLSEGTIEERFDFCELSYRSGDWV